MSSRLIERYGYLIGCGVLLLSACGGGGGGGGSGVASPQVNRPPSKVSENADQTFYGHTFSYDANANGSIFQDPDGDPLTYDVTLNSESVSSYPGFSVLGSVVSGTIDYQVLSMTVQITAKDGRGGAASDEFTLNILDNSVPSVVRPNSSQVMSAGPIDYDVSQSGTTFRDPDGHKLTYVVTVLAATSNFDVQGTRLVGVLNDPGFVKARITATDELGASCDDIVALVVPAQIFSRPVLPVTPYVYDDAALPLPQMHRLSRENGIPLWDTTPVDNPTSNAGAALGRVLFYDKRLSITNTVSCGSCHQQSRGFTVDARFGTGAFGESTHRNPMALGNTRYNAHDRYFFDQRAAGLEALSLMPIEDMVELGSTLPLVEQKLAATDFYPPLFEAAFGSPGVTSERVAKALSQFLRSLLSYQTKFDAVFQPMEGDGGDPNVALTEQELRGQEVYLDSNCAFCHHQNSGAMDDAANNGLDAVSADPGTTREGAHFRPAPLRNIAASGPYMHDGRFSSLREVIDFYDHGVQDNPDLSVLLFDVNANAPRRLNLSEEDKQALEAFLNTFTDIPLLTDPKFSDPFQ